MIAARTGATDVVKLLVESGADRRLRNKKRETAHDVAVAAGHADIAAMLK
jgi:ankyrin repeat protein